MKTKSGAKKRFKITGSGLVCATQSGKRHNMRKRSKKQLRNQRGTTILEPVEAKRALSYFPYGKKKKNKFISIFLNTEEIQAIYNEMIQEESNISS